MEIHKILIKVLVPSLAECFEMYVPQELKLHEIIPLVSNVVEQYSEGQYRSNGKEILCVRDSGKILDINYSAFELGIHNGSALILI